MTSKEKIKEILAVYHEYAKCYDEDDEWNKVDFNYDGETFRIFEEDVEKVKDIKKDLEVLEILKKRLNIKIPYGSVNVISVNNDDDYLLFEVELQEHTKIEEWLNEK